MADEKRWHIGWRSAEGNALFFFEATEDELNAIKKFIDAQDDGPDEGYSGAFGIELNSFDTRKDAELYAKSIHRCIYEILAYHERIKNEEEK